MNQSVLTIFFSAALLYLIAMYVSLIWLARRLKACHPKSYEEAGRPGLISSQIPLRNLRLCKFLFTFRDRELADPVIRKLCWTLRVVTVAPFFVALLGAFLLGMQ